MKIVSFIIEDHCWRCFEDVPLFCEKSWPLLSRVLCFDEDGPAHCWFLHSCRRWCPRCILAASFFFSWTGLELSQQPRQDIGRSQIFLSIFQTDIFRLKLPLSVIGERRDNKNQVPPGFLVDFPHYPLRAHNNWNCESTFFMFQFFFKYDKYLRETLTFCNIRWNLGHFRSATPAR